MRAGPRIGVIGTGFGGLAVAIELLNAGYRDIRLWERADSLGGVWRDNTYPGAGCDVPSPLYSYSFAQSTRWQRRYDSQSEILSYLDDVAAEYRVTNLIRFNHDVTSATLDESSASWDVQFGHGDHDTVDILISAVGQLSDPVIPKLPGTETFTGPAFHSAQWNHDVDLSGRSVAVVGTGASAIQFIPPVAATAAHVTIFQRSPNWILPKFDSDFPRWYAPAMKAERAFFWLFAEQFSKGLDASSRTGELIERWARSHLNQQVADPQLRAQLTPEYPIGCKRILFASNYYPTLSRPNVDLITDEVVAIEPHGLRTADFAVPADVLIYGTGFATQEFLAKITVTGAGGAVLSEQWADGARAHLGIHVPNFPNLFIAYGPNTNLGGGSIIAMLETQARHIRHVIDRMSSGRYQRVEVTRAAEAIWDGEVQAQLSKSAWANCDSWYRHASGRITSNWPSSPHPYARRVQHLDPAEFSWS